MIREDHQLDRDHLLDRAPPHGVSKGPGSGAAGLAMAFKLIEAAEGRWRSGNGPRLVAFVRTSARFERGVLIETGEGIAA